MSYLIFGFKKLLFPSLFAMIVVIIPSVSYCQEAEKERIDSVLSKVSEGDIPREEALSITTEILSDAKTISYSEGIMESHFVLGKNFLSIEKYSDAYFNLKSAQIEAQNQKNDSTLAWTNYLLGNLHAHLGRSDEAIKLYHKALERFEKMDNQVMIGHLCNTLGSVLLEPEQKESALNYLNKSRSIFTELDNERFLMYPIVTLGELYFHHKEYDLAIKQFRSSLPFSKKHEDDVVLASAWGAIGNAYYCMDDLDLAITYIDSCLTLAHSMGSSSIQMKYNKILSDIYIERGNIEKSHHHLKKYIALKDSVFTSDLFGELSETRLNLGTLKLKNDVLKNEQAVESLENEKREARFKYGIIIIGLFAIGVLLISIWFFQRQKSKKRRELLLKNNKIILIEAELVKTNFQNEKLKSEQLEREIQFKNTDVTNFALDLARKNEFMEDTLARLKSLKMVGDDRFKDKLLELIAYFQNQLTTTNDFNEFYENAEIINQKFFQELQLQFPELTKSQLHICGMIRLNLSNKEIATMKNVTLKSVEVSKNRLRKALDLPQREDLYKFLIQLPNSLD